MRVLPSAHDASRTWVGIAISPSRAAPKTSGSAISDIIAPAARNERPKTPPPEAVNESGARIGSWKIARPKIAMTMSGVPATTSIPDSTARASGAGLPYSTSQTADATASGTAIAIPMIVSTIVPEDRVQDAAGRVLLPGRAAGA